LPIAAVLVPVIDRPAGPSLLLTQRSGELRQHAGQIAFPGGRVDPEDADIVAAALRETWEETGISAEFVTPLGGIEPVESVTGYLIFPVIGRVREGFTPLPNTREVDAIFEVPLDFVLDPTNQVFKSASFAGKVREFYSIVYGPHDIWGATARILVNLTGRLNAYQT
jgi:8-oxo-dGTP pyrophosphatase MutT (NUDIX family)